MHLYHHLTVGAALLGSLFTTPIYAQATDPAAATPPLRYESAFSGYREQSAAQKEIAPHHASMDTPIPEAPSPSAASDTRGRIESINLNDAKVKLKHGPIPKFDMPGMTMVFRVQDPKLLAQIKVGDEVGVTLEKSGSGFVITGFQK